MKTDQEKILEFMGKARPFLAKAAKLAQKYDRYFEADYAQDDFQNLVQNALCAERHVEEWYEPIS